MSSSQQKDDFKKYREKSGVLEALTKVLVGLYEEQHSNGPPPNGMEYIKTYLGAPSNVDVEGLKSENESLKAQIKSLQHEVAELKRLAKHKKWKTSGNL